MFQEKGSSVYVRWPTVQTLYIFYYYVVVYIYCMHLSGQKSTNVFYGRQWIQKKAHCWLRPPDLNSNGSGGERSHKQETIKRLPAFIERYLYLLVREGGHSHLVTQFLFDQLP